MIPHGNCRNSSQSRSVVNKDEPTAPRNNYIMREFILDNDIRDYLRNKAIRI